MSDQTETERFSSLDEKALLSACRDVFGPEVELSTQFLDYIQREGLRTAYREQAKRRHPDLHPDQSHSSFTSLRASYESLMEFLDTRERRSIKSNRLNAAAPKRSYYSGPIPKLPLDFGHYFFIAE